VRLRTLSVQDFRGRLPADRIAVLALCVGNSPPFCRHPAVQAPDVKIKAHLGTNNMPISYKPCAKARARAVRKAGIGAFTLLRLLRRPSALRLIDSRNNRFAGEMVCTFLELFSDHIRRCIRGA
jgi:hypothetical protein